MKVDFTCRRFPVTGEALRRAKTRMHAEEIPVGALLRPHARHHRTAGALKQQCGLPFSMVVQPVADPEGQDLHGSDAPPSDEVERCSSCFS